MGLEGKGYLTRLYFKQATVDSKIIRAFEIVRAKKIILNAVL